MAACPGCDRRALKLEEAERFGIEVSKDLDNAKSILERRNKIPTGSFESFLRQQGIDIESALNQMRAEIAWSKLVRQRFSRVATVGEDEVQDVISRFEENVGKPQSRVQEILLRLRIRPVRMRYAALPPVSLSN